MKMDDDHPVEPVSNFFANSVSKVMVHVLEMEKPCLEIQSFKRKNNQNNIQG